MVPHLYQRIFISSRHDLGDFYVIERPHGKTWKYMCKYLNQKVLATQNLICLEQHTLS